MRRWAFAGVLGLIACGGACRDEERRGGAGRCDQAALQATADRVEAALAAWRPGLGVPPDYRVGLDGLWSACPSLPAGFRMFDYTVHPQPRVRSWIQGVARLWDDAEATRPFAAHCPEWAAVLESMATFRGDERAGAMFRGCRLAELGMMKEGVPHTYDWMEVAYGHALLLWLIADGAPQDVAQTIARSLTAGMALSNFMTHEWTVVPGVSSGFAPERFPRELHVTLREAWFDQQWPRVALVQGRLEANSLPLQVLGSAMRKQLLREVTDGPEHVRPVLTIFADPGAPWSTVGKLAAVARQAGFSEIDVRVLAPYLLQPVVALPLFVALVDPPVGTLRIEADRLTLECKGEVRTRTPGQLAAAVAGCAPLRLAAAGETSWQRIAEVLEVLGPLGDDGIIADIEDPLPEMHVDVEMP